MTTWNDYAKSRTGFDADAAYVDVVARFPAGWEYQAPVVEGGRGCLVRQRDFKHLLAARNPEMWPFQIEELETTEKEWADCISDLLKMLDERPPKP